jgi:hypothetical protein
MDNDISIRPAYLDATSAEGFLDTHGFVQPPRISMNSGFNPLDENGDPVLPRSVDLRVIILWENDTRILQDAYDPENPAPPICFSNDKVRASDMALQPQNGPTFLCATCPKAERNIPGFKGKSLVSACKEEYKIACLVAGAGSKIFLLKIGVGSRQAYGRYCNFLKQHHALPSHVITKLDYADNTFGFSFLGWVDPPLAERVKALRATDEPAMIVGGGPQRVALPAPPVASVNIVTTGGNSNIPYLPDDIAPAPVPGAEEFLPDHVPPPAKRRGRPPKDMFAQAGLAPAASAAPSTPQVSPPAPKPSNGGGFGMEAPKAPDAALQAALERAFMK